MDATRKLGKLNNKGIAAVYLAIMIVVLVAIVSFVVDIGYMYVAKGQLQNAADAGALAGAAKLDKTNSTTQAATRLEAETFANTNNVVPSGTKVIISNAGSNALASGNDITVGNWDASITPQYLEGRTPINAVQVRARRTSDSPGGAVDTFLGGIFSLVNSGSSWNTMGTSSEAVAAIIARATTYIAVCQNFCPGGTGNGTTTTLNPPRVLVTGTAESAPPTETPSDNLFAWSSITEKPTGPGINLNDIICGTTPNVAACGSQIYTTMGGDTVTLRKMESVMYNPNLDAAHKDIDNAGNVTGWTVTIPITDVTNGQPSCPPGTQGIGVGNDPKNVWGYAEIHIIAICAPGGGNGCGGGGNNQYRAPNSVCNAYSPNSVIVIDKITCVTCANMNQLPGLKPSLVR